MNNHMKMTLLVQMVLLPAGGEWSEISTDSNLAASGVLSAFECQCQPLIEWIRVMTHWGWNKYSFSWNWFMGQLHNDEVPELILNSCRELSHKIYRLKSSPWQWNPDGNVHDSPLGLFWFRVGPSPLEINRSTGKPVNPLCTDSRANGQLMLLSKFRALPDISEGQCFLHMVQSRTQSRCDFEQSCCIIMIQYGSMWMRVMSHGHNMVRFQL